MLLVGEEGEIGGLERERGGDAAVVRGPPIISISCRHHQPS